MRVAVDEKSKNISEAINVALKEEPIDRVVVSYMSSLMRKKRETSGGSSIIDLSLHERMLWGIDESLVRFFESGLVMLSYQQFRSTTREHIANRDFIMACDTLEKSAKAVVDSFSLSGFGAKHIGVRNSHHLCVEKAGFFAERNYLLRSTDSPSIRYLSVPDCVSVFTFRTDYGGRPRNGYISRLDFVYPSEHASVSGRTVSWRNGKGEQYESNNW